MANRYPSTTVKNHADDAEPERGPGVLKGVKGGRVEPAQGGREQPDRRSGQNAPDVYGHAPGKLTGLIQRTCDHVSQDQERYRRWHHEERDLSESALQPGPKLGGKLTAFSSFASHGRQLGRRDRHAEEAHRKGVEHLRIGEGRHRASGKQACQHGVDVGTDLYHAAAYEYWNEIPDDRHEPQRTVAAMSALPPRTRKDRRQLNAELKGTASTDPQAVYSASS